MDINIEDVKNAINIADFNHTELLEIALTHPSYIYEDRNLNPQQKATDKLSTKLALD